MKNRRNYYRLLQVQPDATTEIIRASYRTLLRELRQHPDLGGNTQMAADLNEAYEVLSDSARRAEYDRELSINFSRKKNPTSPGGKVPHKSPACPFCQHGLERRAQPGDRCGNCDSPVRSQEMADLEDASRRSVPRIRRDDRITYYTAWPQKAREAHLIDLSPKGTRFFCSEPIRKGNVIKISARSFDALATVTNISSGSNSGKGVYSIGASFIAVDFRLGRGAFVSISV